jgi:hypothetical protein
LAIVIDPGKTSDVCARIINSREGAARKQPDASLVALQTIATSRTPIALA